MGLDNKGGRDSDRKKRAEARARVDEVTLTVHRLPRGTTEKQLMRVLLKKTGVNPMKVRAYVGRRVSMFCMSFLSDRWVRM